MKQVKVALLGFGTVGKGVYNLLNENKALWEKEGLIIKVKKVLEINEKAKAGYPAELFTSDFNDIAKDPEISIVAEMMGGVNPAADFMVAALNAGKNVVSSNKEALATKLAEIGAAAKVNGKKLMYEAAVCGAIPVMNVINTSMASNKISKIEGIVNGTSNYILTQMAEDLSYEEALKQAQEKGFAEANPAKDVEGIDAMFKIILLCYSACGVYISPDEIKPVGITSVSKQDIADAKAQGKAIKLIASADLSGDKPVLSVKPQMVSLDSPLGRTNYEFNAVNITGNMAGDIFMSGRGAGMYPTASAVCADIIDIAKHC